MTMEIGQRVKLSAEGIESLWQTKRDRDQFRGTVVGGSHDGLSHRIKWDHLVYTESVGDIFLAPDAPRERSGDGTRGRYIEMSAAEDVYAVDEALVSRLYAESLPVGRKMSMVRTGDLRAFIADYRLKCELIHRLAPQPSERSGDTQG
jgi:hypothetical protein